MEEKIVYLIKDDESKVIFKSDSEESRDKHFDKLKEEGKDYSKDELKLYEE